MYHSTFVVHHLRGIFAVSYFLFSKEEHEVEHYMLVHYRPCIVGKLSVQAKTMYCEFVFQVIQRFCL